MQRVEAGTPTWLLQIFGAALVSADRMPWGFRNETWRVDVRDGTMLVVKRRDSPPDVDAAGAAQLAREALLLAGISVPETAPGWATGRTDVVVTRYVDGNNAAELIGKVGGAEQVGRLAGEVAKAISRVPLSRLPREGPWSRTETLVVAATAWLELVQSALPPSAIRQLQAATEIVACATSEQDCVLVHGDLVPVNLLQSDGRLVAVLDLDDSRFAHGAFDAAWFDWIVWYHHPSERADAWQGFVAGADGQVELGSIPLRRSLASVRILEVLADAVLHGARNAWQEQLIASLDRPSH